MCGIVGLHLKDPELEPQLGQLLTPMLRCMSSRGPDSAGVAVYTPDLPDGALRFTIRLEDPSTADQVAADTGQLLGSPVRVEQTNLSGAVFVADAEPNRTVQALQEAAPDSLLIGFGHHLEVVKDVGLPEEVAQRYGVPSWTGYQGIGHTRMATESAVTPEHSHPFIPAPDLAVVHNGQFSNYATVRRDLMREGVEFVTDNDTEVCARYIAFRMSQGDTLETALEGVLEDFDGFFTLLVTTADTFAVLRDEFAGKPAVIGETDSYVAMASEYFALAGLPDIESANIFEPRPEEIHLWKR